MPQIALFATNAWDAAGRRPYGIDDVAMLVMDPTEE
jgi:hypothetical protein